MATADYKVSDLNMQYERLTPKDLVETINMPQYGDNTRILLYAQRLWDLENQIERGELVKLPCKLGENFVIKAYGFNRLRVEQRRIVGYNFSQFESTIYPVDEYENSYSPDKVFFTKEEAEQRLKELKENVGK